MAYRRLKWGLALLALVVLTLLVGAAHADEEAQEMVAYWGIVGAAHQSEPLARAMDGDASLTLDELKAITKDELLAFAAAYKLPVGMARYAWYTSLADKLAEAIPATSTGERLALFLAMKDTPRDKSAKEERKAIRRSITEADIHAYAAETGLPEGFLCWLLLDDEWHEPEWDDGDDWQEGRKDWDIPDWADAKDLRDKYGKDAVVTEDDVEKLLRQHGYDFDD